MSNSIKPLDIIIQEYEDLRQSFRNFTKRGDGNKGSLIEFQSSFVDLRADLRHWHAYVAEQMVKRDDKQATAIKFRIAVAISEGDFKDEEGKLIYDKCSITSAEKYASGSQKYKEFLEQRSFYKQSYVNITDLREDITAYINETKDRLK
jgi:hypothetical protein